MGNDELETFLAGLATRMAAQLDGDPPDQRLGQEIGADLVTAHVASPEAIGRTIEVVAARLLPEVVRADGHCRDRLAELLGAVTTGFARALRDRTLDEQEAIRRAALLARQHAEQALRESEARFRYQATHDPLTDLANRILFTDRLAALFARGTGSADSPRRLGVCFVDLDGFKIVNDTLGHQVGDLLLVEVAGRLRRHLPGQLVARLGGDEFVILIEDTTDTDHAVTVARTALAAISEPANVDGHQLAISGSIGIVERELGMTSPSEVMRAADVTLQWAKQAGKGRWAVFDPVRNERELAQHTLAAAIPGALDRGELFLEYQPIVSLADGSLRGLEALVRWRHPEHGVLTPDQFLGLAEETGQIVRLGGWVLAQACRQARHWQGKVPDPPFVSVNLAPRQTRDPALVDIVTRLLDETGLAPHLLQLEITEGAVASEDGEPIRALHQLADRGVRIAVDEFGTGTCTLPYLRNLPVRELKIAGVYVAGLPVPAPDRDPEPTVDERILATVVALAHTLGLTVTGTGVETAAQARQLRAIGCDTAQGWHFGHPTSSERLTGRLAGEPVPSP
ncbi:MAG: EAL domain-containing protein [Micromonosporaceae bacterium]|nr:EAL domain-containing protein [Micromonosporaceae bacterium]